MTKESDPHPRIVVIGGGVAGLSVAFHIRTGYPQAELLLLEQGDTIPYAYGTSTRSAACERSQFGCPHNVQMSLYSIGFYERFYIHTGETSQMLWQKGYLFLYRDPQRWEKALKKVALQQSWGLQEVVALSPDEVVKQFPFVADYGLVGGTFCPRDGFLDPNVIMNGFQKKLEELGVQILISSCVTAFRTAGTRVTHVVIADGTEIPCDLVVNATGAWASRIGRILGSDVPVMPEKRYLWTAKFANPADDFMEDEYAHFPMTVCMADGMVPYVKPEPSVGTHVFTIGCEHKVAPDWDFQPEDQDRVEPGFYAYDPNGYHLRFWEILADWLPCTEKFAFQQRPSAGYYETTKDNNPFIDFDPNFPNVIHCAGFSGHGVMHAPAAGRAVLDLVLYGVHREFPSGNVNLSFEGYQRGIRQTEEMKI